MRKLGHDTVGQLKRLAVLDDSTAPYEPAKLNFANLIEFKNLTKPYKTGNLANRVELGQLFSTFRWASRSPPLESPGKPNLISNVKPNTH